MTQLLAGFEPIEIDVDGIRISGRMAGSGAHFRDPAVIAASCEDYRAAATIDLDHDERSYTSGERITCPLLVMWGTAGFVGRHYDVPAVWKSYAADVSTMAVAGSGHFLAEEAPEATTAALTQFLG